MPTNLSCQADARQEYSRPKYYKWNSEINVKFTESSLQINLLKTSAQ